MPFTVGERRQLSGVQDITSPLPSRLTVTVGELPGAAQGADLDVVAGVGYSEGIRLTAPGRAFSRALDGVARLRLVSEATPAHSGGCRQTGSYWPGGTGFQDGAVTLVVDGGTARSAGPISFMLAGHYRLCYTHDGSFGASSELLAAPRNLQVRGAKLDCMTDRCFEEHRWHCFAYRDARAPEGSCVLRFDSVDYIHDTSATSLSWGPTVRIVLGSVVGWSCGGAPSSRLEAGYQLPIPGSVGREFAMNALPSNTGFSVQACYCPMYDGCDADSDFVQPVGRVHFFYVRICDDAACSNEFLTALPGAPFTLHIDCAGARACSTTADNRVKLVDSSPLGANDRPSWAENAGCRLAAQTERYWGPRNCAAGQVAECGGPGGAVNGGAGSEGKVFERLALGPVYMAGIPFPRDYDVCYCDGRCEASGSPDAAERFQKVGRVQVRPHVLVRSRESGADTGLAAVGVTGDLMVDGHGNIPLAPRPAQVKLLWDNLRQKTSASCRSRQDLVDFRASEGPRCASDDACSYRATTMETNPPDNFFGTGAVVHFNDGGTQGERIRFSRAGVVAICYCGTLADGSGAQGKGSCLREGDFSYWMLMARTVIRGPCILNAESSLCEQDSWTFYTGIPFRLTIRGIGLKSTDKIRIIPGDGQCMDNPDGGGEASVLKGCPGACSPLDLADLYLPGGGPGKDDIDVLITGSSTVRCGLQHRDCRTASVLEVLPSADHTIWRFDEAPGLAAGDLVVLENVTGGTAEENALMAGRFGLEPLGWPVTPLADPLLFRVPAHLDRAPGRFAPSGGWYRHSVACTREELQATEAKSLLQVCWGSGPDTYHAPAGLISFLDPEAMSFAMVALSGFEGGARAPVVAAFSTNSGGEAARKYRGALNSMQLRLSFGDTTRVEPRLADVNGQPFPVTAPEDRDDLSEAKQVVCGTLFLEMWSDDEKGFPLPKGCYYSSLMQNSRVLHILFEPRSGLEAGRMYQLVLNARVAVDASTLDTVLHIYAMDDVELSPYGVVERGDARLSRNPEAASGVGKPRFDSSGGLTLLGEGGDLHELIELTADPVQLLFRVRGDGQSRITPGSLLRVFLWPLTVWELHDTCQAQCYPHRTLTCGAITSCTCEAVVSGQQRNTVLLQMPVDMTEIYGASVQHTVRISGLPLPQLGFFGTRFGAQISTPDDLHVHYVESSGAHAWKVPGNNDPQAAVASIVTHAGDGNDRPFCGDAGNTLYVRLALGATLMSELHAGDASFSLRLPPGFACRGVAPAPDSLGVFGSSQPQGRGSLPSSAGVGTGGSWHLAGHTCQYHLEAGELIPARSRVFLQLIVDQPGAPLQRANALNQWFVELASKGRFRWAHQRMDPAPFVEGALQDGEHDDFAANVPVLGRLAYDSLQPMNFGAGARGNVLQVFFKPEQSSGYNGMVLVAAPAGFNFAVVLPDKCTVSRLLETYYQATGGQQRTEYLPIMRSCVADCSVVKCPETTFNRARIGIKNSLQPEHMYGFSVELINKPDYTPGDEDSWMIMTADASGHSLDASSPHARLNPAVGGTSRAWGVYEHHGDPAAVVLQIPSLMPTSVRGALSSVTLSSVQLPDSVSTTCRLLAPGGFWLTPLDFLYHPATVPGITASWPGGRPWQSLETNPGHSNAHGDQAKNVLLWDEATYLRSEKYGFTSRLKVPDHPVVATSSVFILQFGWEGSQLQDRSISFSLPAPAVRSITDFAIQGTSNVIGLRQLLTIVLRTSVDIPVGGTLRLDTPPGFTFEDKCTLDPVPGETRPPEVVTCTSMVARASGATAVSIVLTETAWPSGRLAFRLGARNPAVASTNRGGQGTSCGFEQCWSVYALDARGVPTERHGVAPGFAVNHRMPEAKLVDLTYAQRMATGRNDRPGVPNNLVFSFRLAARPASIGDLLLSGPHGFSFDEDCLSGLLLDDGLDPERNVFGYLKLPFSFTRWEVAARVHSCISTGSAVRMRINLGLRAGRAYAFRIHVTANPVEMPDPNTWTLEYSGESCLPFEGLTLWTFTEASLQPVFTGAGMETARTATPVVFRFRPYREVPADPRGQGSGGLLRVTAPQGFLAAGQGTLGQSCAAYELLEGQSQFTPERHVKCRRGGQDQPSVLTLQLTGSRKLEVGRRYVLTVQFYSPLTASGAKAPWLMTTFNNPSGAMEAALDATSVAGFVVNAPPGHWTVAVPPGPQHARALVPGVSLQVAFKTELTQGHKIRVVAPAGFDLAAQRDCSAQVGKILGGTKLRVGLSTSLEECAELVWQKSPAATASSWQTLSHQCFAHVAAQSLEICSAESAAVVNAAQVNMNAARQAPPPQECSSYTHHVCSFAGLSRNCHDFRLAGKSQHQLLSLPVCEANTLLFRLVVGEVLPTTAVLAFSISTRNPAQSPGLTESFWMVEHYGPDNALEASGAVPGWTVIPRLEDARVQLTGLQRALGAPSQLTVDFVPTSDADAVQITALAPPGFNLSSASVATAARWVTKQEAASVTIACALTGGRLLQPSLVVDNVQLSEPGPAVFSLATFQGAFKADETLLVSGQAAFSVPGWVQATQQRLHLAEVPQVNAQSLKSALQPRAGDPCVASFLLSFGARALAGDVLLVLARPFSFCSEGTANPGDPFELSAASTGAIVPTLPSTGEDCTSLELALGQPLEVGEDYALRMLTRPGPPTGHGERWRFRTLRGGLLVNTNDAGLPGFQLSPTVALSLATGRATPSSSLAMEVTAELGSIKPERLVIHAPQGFSFPEGNCLATSPMPGTGVAACHRLGEEHVAVLELSAAALRAPPTAHLEVRTPARLEPGAPRAWLVRALEQSTEAGWGVADGFPLVEMEVVRLVHAAAPATKAYLAVIFSTTQSLLNGGTLGLTAPGQYKLSCRQSDGFWALSVPAVQPCSDMGSSVRIALSETLAPGTYAIVLSIFNPAFTPTDNFFTLALRDRRDNVVDARMHLEGNPILQGLNVFASEIAFSSSTASTQAQIQVPFKVSAAIDASQAIWPVRALQIVAPERFTLITRAPLVNHDGFPTPEYGWYHLYSAERLARIDLVRGVNDTPDTIPQGSYRFSFQVRLPEFWMPNVNVWVLSLCRDLRCKELVSDIVMPGFDFGDVAILGNATAGDSSEGGGAQPERGPARFGLLISISAVLIAAAAPSAASTAGVAMFSI